MKKIMLFVAFMSIMGIVLSQSEPRVNRGTYTVTKYFCIPHETTHLWGYVYEVKNPKEKADFHVKIIKNNTEAADIEIAIDPVDRGEYGYEKGVWHFVKNRKKARFSVKFVDNNEGFSVRIVPIKKFLAEKEFWGKNWMRDSD